MCSTPTSAYYAYRPALRDCEKAVRRRACVTKYSTHAETGRVLHRVIHMVTRILCAQKRALGPVRFLWSEPFLTRIILVVIQIEVTNLARNYS